MHKFITSNFELDLSTFEISLVEENYWFSDTYFTKYSFPTDIKVGEELQKELGYLFDHNYADAETIFQGTYVNGDTMELGVLEVENVLDNETLSVSIRWGFEELPCFQKKLSALSLDKFELPEGVSIYDYAVGIISQTWPAVNFNFPQIHTDKIDTSDDIYAFFEKIINNYKEGAFLINEVDIVDDITYNRNIMQPLPYHLHILTRAFAEDGYTLKGDLVEDEIFQKKLLFGDVDYATTYDQQSVSLTVLNTEGVYDGNLFTTYNKSVDIPFPGKYRVVGQVSLRIFTSNVPKWIEVRYRDTVLFAKWKSTAGLLEAMTTVNYEVDAIFETISDEQPNTITVVSYQNVVVGDDVLIIADLNINPIRLHDSSGEAIPTIINQNKIDLPRAVPDVQFVDYLKYLKNKYNVDLTIKGKDVFMNFVENEIRDAETVDLTKYEVKAPLRKKNKGISFLLKFEDVDSKDYKYLPVFQNANGFTTSSFITDEKTKEIVLDGLPLPLMFRNGVQTAHAFEDSEDKIYSVLYDGLTGGLNLAKDPTPILIPAVHEKYNKAWFENRINATAYVWQFKLIPEVARLLNSKSKVFAYGRNHLTKIVTKTQIKPDVWEIDLETETLK